MPRRCLPSRRRALLIAALALELGAIAGFLAYRRVGGANRCFPETGACVAGAFARHWAAGGGLDRFGYPLTGELDEVGADGRTRRVQYFERARFEVQRRGPRPLGSVADRPLDGYAALGRSPGGEPAATPRFDPQRLTLELEEVARGLRQPLFVTHAGDGSGRLFVVEKGGTIRTLPGAAGGAGGDLFLDIADRVGSGGSEQGLLGLAFHPRFRENGYLYVNYTGSGTHSVQGRPAFWPVQEEVCGPTGGGLLAIRCELTALLVCPVSAPKLCLSPLHGMCARALLFDARLPITSLPSVHRVYDRLSPRPWPDHGGVRI